MPRPESETKLADHLFAVFSTWILPVLVIILYGLTAWYFYLYSQPIGSAYVHGQGIGDWLRQQQLFSIFASCVSLACQLGSWLHGRQRKRLYVLIGLAVLYLILWIALGQDPAASMGG